MKPRNNLKFSLFVWTKNSTFKKHSGEIKGMLSGLYVPAGLDLNQKMFLFFFNTNFRSDAFFPILFSLMMKVIFPALSRKQQIRME